MEKRLAKVADELGIEVIIVLQLAKRLETGHSATEEDIEKFKKKLSGYYDLAESDIRKLEDILQKPAADAILKESAVLIAHLNADQQKKYLMYVSEQIYRLIDDKELRDKIKPETTYETIMNLGVINIKRSGAASSETKKTVPIGLLNFDPDVARSVMKQHFLDVLETFPLKTPADFDSARKHIAKDYSRVVAEVAEYAK
jgi:hypothetical protein